MSLNRPAPKMENPYAPPTTINQSDPLPRPPRRGIYWLKALSIAQALILIVGTGFAKIEIESIIPFGGVLVAVAIVMCIVGAYSFRFQEVAIGSACILFAFFIAFLINYNSWSPDQAAQPVFWLIVGFTTILVPILIRSISAAHR